MMHAPDELEDAGVGMCVAVIQGIVYVPHKIKLWFLLLSGNVVQKTIEVRGNELVESAKKVAVADVESCFLKKLAWLNG